MYTIIRFENVEFAHVQVEKGGQKSFPCGFDSSKHRMEKSSLRLDLKKIRVAVAKSANADSDICGICVGALYSL
ncbi:hypothetical protein JWG41_05950 [Leptospira sp. 201903075]|uniref:hypothetical protein n=1 Tax=Leptospira chreensis TaxID=2810035 RepID=UPI001962DAF0|nr:hypothetical protein [Leptospira chreensis]MBM9589979.1 hypothetical protein [Leptospira chreensis]